MTETMHSIYKYPLYSNYEQITMPFGSTILSAKKQGSYVVLYALISLSEERNEEYEVIVNNTGDPVEVVTSNYKYLDTLMFNHGQYVEHVFYRKIEEVTDDETDD